MNLFKRKPKCVKCNKTLIDDCVEGGWCPSCRGENRTEILKGLAWILSLRVKHHPNRDQFVEDATVVTLERLKLHPDKSVRQEGLHLLWILTHPDLIAKLASLSDEHAIPDSWFWA